MTPPQGVTEVPLYAKNSREEEAELALKRTRVTPAMAWVLVVAFIVTLFSEPILQALFEPPHAATPGAETSAKNEPSGLQDRRVMFEVFNLLPSYERADRIARERGTEFDPFWRTWYSMATVKEITGFEKKIEETSIIGQALLPPSHEFMSRFLGVGNEQAYLGRDGWLFYRPEVDYLMGPGFLDPKAMQARAHSGDASTLAVQPNPVPAIVRLHQQLAARGIRLIVLPAPLKPSLEPHRLTSRYSIADTPVQNPSYNQWLREMADAGVTVADFSDELAEVERATGEPQFLRTDTHWTPEAMERVTARLAEFIRKSHLLPDTPAAGYRRQAIRVSGTGDIAEMLKLPKDQTLYPPQEITVQRVLSADGEPWKRNRQADVLVLGDSFCNVYSMKEMNWGDAAGFCEQLSYHLQRPLDKIALNAGGSYSSRQQLAKDMLAEDRLAGKRLVIYEFAMRDLAAGDWKLIDLPEAPKTGTTPPVRPPVAKGELVVEGRIKAIATTPKPATVAYADCVIALQLVDAKVLGGTSEKREFAVYIMGMRNHQWTAAASLAAGQTVRLRLVLWSTVEDQYDGLNRVDLSELAEETDYYWAQP